LKAKSDSQDSGGKSFARPVSTHDANVFFRACENLLLEREDAAVLFGASRAIRLGTRREKLFEVL
jgi:hypothetical protein